MDLTTRDPLRRDFLADCERIHREWDSHAKSLDTDSLISLYAQDAILETPLVPAIFEGRSGVPRGHREIRPLLPSVPYGSARQLSLIPGAITRPSSPGSGHRAGNRAPHCVRSETAIRRDRHRYRTCHACAVTM